MFGSGVLSVTSFHVTDLDLTVARAKSLAYLKWSLWLISVMGIL